MKDNVIKQLTDREHVILRPGQYIGSTTLTKTSTFVLDEKREHFIYKEIEYVPGFLKIIYEVLDNSVDEAIRTGFKKACKIDVSIDQKEGRVTIADDGRGIPLDNMKNSDMSMLEGALTCLRAGSNFNDDEGRNLLGMNGVGSSLTNIFSKEFTADVYDGKRHGVLKCSDNLAEKSCKIKESAVKKTGTTISFIPDLKRFGLKKIDDVHVDLVYQRLVFLSLTYPEIKFTFNGKTVAFKNAKSFLHAFSEKFVAVQDENYPAKFLIGVIPNTTDEFNHKSYINGADCILGGNHLNVISNELVKRIREKLSKKYPSIKVGDIKNRMSFIVNFREFINPMFNSQTKENFSSSEQEIKEFLKNVDWDEFATKICKCQEIIDPIVESFKIKEELQNRKTLDKIGSSPKKFRCKKFMPATKTNKYCLICEGDSANLGLSEGLGRENCGFFATRGVPLNTYEVPPSKIAENEELSNIIKVLGLKLGAETQNMTYENVVIASDADCLDEFLQVKTKRGDIALNEVVPGDLVWTKEKRWRKVEKVIRKRKTSWVRLDTEDGALDMTYGHEMFIKNEQDSMFESPAKEICISDSLVRDNGESLPLKSIVNCKGEKFFIDLTVEEDHSFYVKMPNAETYVLSHNCDGAHITMLYIAFFSKYCPSVIKEKRLKKLMTPIICLKDSKDNIKEMFFTFDEFNSYMEKHPDNKLRVHYYKGLGSWEKKDLSALVAKYGIDKFIQPLEYDADSLKIIDDWISKKKADVRKEYLKENEFSIFSI